MQIIKWPLVRCSIECYCICTNHGQHYSQTYLQRWFFFISITSCPRGSVPVDIAYAKVDTITSFSIPLAEAKILVRNALFDFYFLQYIVLKGKAGFDECELVVFLCTFLCT